MTQYICKYPVIYTIYLMIVTMFVSCNDYNPFKDYDNASAVIVRANFTDEDTVTIFSLETLSITITVPNLIDSVTVVSEGNRFFNDGMKTIKCGNTDSIVKSLKGIVFSYWKPGEKQIDIRVYRQNGEVLSQKKKIYVRLPEYAETVKGYYNQNLQLSCESVNDKSIMYQWQISDTTIKERQGSSLVKLINSGEEQGTGYLVLTDGIYMSSMQTFKFEITDTSAPVIKIPDDLKMRNDTILSGNSELPLKLFVSDIGQNKNLKVSINGADSFDIRSGNLYVKIIGGLDKSAGLKKIAISAQDNAIIQNTASKVIWLGYDQNAVKSKQWALSMLIPSTDTSKSSISAKTIYGLIERYNKDTLPVKVDFYVNDLKRDSIFNVTGNEWSGTVELDTGKNMIKVIAVKGNEADSVSRTIFYSKSLNDTMKPVLKNITIDGLRDNRFITDELIDISVIAFDEGGKVQSVTCNGENMKNQNKSEYVWNIENLKLNFIDGVAEVNIAAADVKNNTVIYSKKIWYNTLPRIIKTPLFESPARAGRLYTDAVKVNESDKYDLIQYSLTCSDSTSMKIDKKGNVVWKPLKNATVEYTIRIFDRFETVSFSDTLFVVDSNTVINKLDIDNVVDRFPDVLSLSMHPSENDTMKVNCTPLSGTPPYYYNVTAMGSSLQPSMKGDTLIWVSSKSDTGIIRFEIIVSDKYDKKDTVNPVVALMRGNQPFTVACSLAVDTFPDRTIDMSSQEKKGYINISIADPDYEDSYTVYIKESGVLDTLELQNMREFKVELYGSLLKSGMDTIDIRITDNGGHEIRYDRIVNYGMILQKCELKSPRNSDTITDSAISFVWYKNSIQNVQYELYAGSAGDTLGLIYKGYDTAFTYYAKRMPGMYLCQLYVSNGKARLGGSLQFFIQAAEDTVKIMSSSDMFGSYSVADHDTIHGTVNLQKVNGSVKYSAYFMDNLKLFSVFGAHLSYIPAIVDTGYRKIAVVAIDTLNGTSDTIVAEIVITEKKPVLYLETESSHLKNDILLMESGLVSDTILVSIKTDIAIARGEIYDVTVFQRNTVARIPIGNTNTFTITVDQLPANETSDIIDINVVGSSLGEVTKKIIVLKN